MSPANTQFAPSVEHCSVRTIYPLPADHMTQSELAFRLKAATMAATSERSFKRVLNENIQKKKGKIMTVIPI